MNNKRKYPDEFVVEGLDTKYVWDIKYNTVSNAWEWFEREMGYIVSHTAQDLDDCSRERYKFIFPETPKEEPELVFPFTMKEQKGDGCHYRVTKEAAGIYLYDLDSPWVSQANLYSEGSIKRFIKSGEWVVQSVGEQKPLDDDPAETAYWNFDARMKGYGEWKDRPIQSERDAFKAEYRNAVSKPVEAPQSDVKTTCVGALTIDTSEALARIKELTEAVDNLTDAYANLGATMKRFNNV